MDEDFFYKIYFFINFYNLKSVFEDMHTLILFIYEEIKRNLLVNVDAHPIILQFFPSSLHSFFCNIEQKMPFVEIKHEAKKKTLNTKLLQ